MSRNAHRGSRTQSADDADESSSALSDSFESVLFLNAITLICQGHCTQMVTENTMAVFYDGQLSKYILHQLKFRLLFEGMYMLWMLSMYMRIHSEMITTFRKSTDRGDYPNTAATPLTSSQCGPL